MFVPRSPDDVYPPLRVEEQDDYLLSNLDMDFSNISVIPPVSRVNDAVKFHKCKKIKEVKPTHTTRLSFCAAWYVIMCSTRSPSDGASISINFLS